MPETHGIVTPRFENGNAAFLLLQGDLVEGRSLIESEGDGSMWATDRRSLAARYHLIFARYGAGHGGWVDVAIDYEKADVVFDILLAATPTVRKPGARAQQFGRGITIVDGAQPQNAIQAWGTNASYHFIFARQNRGKLDVLSALIERGQLGP